MQKIAVIYTGGTIGMHYVDKKGKQQLAPAPLESSRDFIPFLHNWQPLPLPEKLPQEYFNSAWTTELDSHAEGFSCSAVAPNINSNVTQFLTEDNFDLIYWQQLWKNSAVLPLAGDLSDPPMQHATQPQKTAFTTTGAPISHIQRKQVVDLFSWKHPIDSSSISADSWQLLFDTIHSGLAHYDAFVVLHGTDTLSYSTAVFSFLFADFSKKIIFTGSMVPFALPNSDAPWNFFCALNAAGDREIRSGVWLSFGDHLLPGTRCTKTGDQQRPFATLKATHSDIKSSLVNSLFFRARFQPDEFQADEKQFSLDWAFPHQNTSQPEVLLSNRLFALTLTPSLQATDLAPMLQSPHFDAFLFLCYGGGNIALNADLHQVIRAALNQKKLLAFISQTPFGIAESTTYETSLQAVDSRCICLKDATFEAAYTKIMWVLALAKSHGVELDHPDIRNLLQQNLVGEMQ